MSSLDVIYFLVLLGTGFVLGWGFHLIKTENEMEADIGLSLIHISEPTRP